MGADRIGKKKNQNSALNDDALIRANIFLHSKASLSAFQSHFVD